MIASLLQDLASKIMVDQRADISGLDLINKVIEDPAILWRKYFFNSVNQLDEEQQDVLMNWFLQMTKVSKFGCRLQ